MKRKNNLKLVDAGKWLLTSGIASMTISGISLVYIDIYSIATLEQSANNIGAFFLTSFYLNLFLIFLLILGVCFTRLGVHILQKKLSSKTARKPLSIALFMTLLSLCLSGVAEFAFGFIPIRIFYIALIILDIITIISLLRFFMKK